MAIHDDHFLRFAKTLETEIGLCGKTTDWNERQKAQVDQLIAKEAAFRDRLVRHQYGPFVYRRFVTYICDEQKNILDARPYFRERQEVFAAEISRALKVRNAKELYRFAVNYRFIVFAMKARKWGARSPLTYLAEEITKLRQEIVVMNMPLGINRARLFFSRTPKSHLSQMDFIQIASEGLMSGIDKYGPGDEGVITKKFRATAIGRMGGDFIEEYSQTLLHFFPVDKRKLYRAHKAVGRSPGVVDCDKLAADVNAGSTKSDGEETGALDEAHRTTPDEIADLMAAASTVSSDSSLSTDPDAPEPIERFAAPDSTRPDRRVEDKDAIEKMVEASNGLTVFERKVLRLYGLRF
jgi:hypothetical protein